MKYLPSIAFEEMSGSAKGLTAATTPVRNTPRNRGYGGSVRTSSQAAVKSVFKALSQSWRSLTNEQILAWTAMAASQKGRSVLGTASKISGSNLYSRLNFWIVRCGGEALASPPELTGVEAPAEAAVELTDGTFSFHLPPLPADVTGPEPVIMASAPQSNGISNAYAKAVQIGGVREVVSTSIDILSDYAALFGEPGEAAPKVFMKYFFVNSATGEKSGEMLHMAVYTPAP